MVRGLLSYLLRLAMLLILYLMPLVVLYGLIPLPTGTCIQEQKGGVVFSDKLHTNVIVVDFMCRKNYLLPVRNYEYQQYVSTERMLVDVVVDKNGDTYENCVEKQPYYDTQTQFLAASFSCIDNTSIVLIAVTPLRPGDIVSSDFKISNNLFYIQIAGVQPVFVNSLGKYTITEELKTLRGGNQPNNFITLTVKLIIRDGSIDTVSVEF